MNRVYFQFTKFIDIDENGNEKSVNFGYRIFDEYGLVGNQNFTISDLKEITPNEALEMIEKDYVEFFDSILENGFYFNGVWHLVNEEGEIVIEGEE